MDILDVRARVLVIQAARGGSECDVDLIPDGFARLLVRPLGRFSQAIASRRTGSRVPVVGNRQSALGGHAAAWIDGHVPQASDRLASRRARRAAAAPDVRSAGTGFPVPKYIPSGVCPRYAECGSTRLCS
jgi:hypothetical protein